MTSFTELTVEQIQEQIRERLADIRPCLHGFTVTIVDDQIFVAGIRDNVLRQSTSGKANAKVTVEATD